MRIDHNVEGVNVNLAGREPNGCVGERDFEAVRDEVVRAARAVVDPITGARVITAARRREDVYAGDHASVAPDVVLELDPGLEFGIGAELRQFYEVAESRLGRSSATHRPYGILAVAGPGVRSGDLGGVSLVDVPATLLWALGLPLPSDMDGRVLTEAFEPDVVGSHEVRFVTGTTSAAEAGAYSEEEEKQMVAHLEDLGYA